MLDEAPQREKFTVAQLVLAAAALAVVGLVLIFGFGGDDSDEPGTSQPASQADGDDAGAADDDGGDGDDANSAPDVTSSPEPSTTADDETSPPPLPPGMERPGPTEAPDPATVDHQSPSQIALAALTAAYSMDTTTDESPADAMQRVEPWLADTWKSREYDLKDLEDEVEDDWNDWADHDGYASINVIQDVISNDAVSPQERGDTETTAMRKIAVSFTPLGRDGWNGQLEDATWYVHMERPSASDPWTIVEMRRPVFDPTTRPLPTGSPNSWSSTHDPGNR